MIFKKMNEFQSNANKQLKKLRKPVQNRRAEFNRGRDSEKKNPKQKSWR